MKLKLITKILTLCSKPEKLHGRVFHSLSSCSFTFTWWTVGHFQTGPPREIFLGGTKPILGPQKLQNCFEINKN